MYYCSYCDIAHEDKNCPLCEAKSEIEKLNKEIENLQNQE
jgi:rubrerythrin